MKSVTRWGARIVSLGASRDLRFPRSEEFVGKQLHILPHPFQFCNQLNHQLGEFRGLREFRGLFVFHARSIA